MRINLYSNKGGVGLTVTAASLALLYSRTDTVCLVAATFAEFEDMSAVLGLPAQFDRSVAVTDRLTLAMDAPADGVVVTVSGGRALGAINLEVVRACYLNLRRSIAHTVPDGLVLVTEPGRALGVADVERAIGAPCVAAVPVDPSVARAVDAGLLASRLPAVIAQPMGSVIRWAESLEHVAA